MTKRKKEKELFLDFNKEELKNKAKENIRKILGGKININAKNSSQKELISSIDKNEITICSGLAGSGKSFVALAIALNMLVEENNYYQKLYLIKSVTTLKGEEIGYLKGDMYEKLSPFMWSFDLNIAKIINEDRLRELVGTKIINYMPLAYIRGTTIDNAIIIIDEMQNVSLDNARTALTRIGENCKIICLGDENQIDLKNQQESSLSILMNILSNIEGIGIAKMDDSEKNVRNPIIPKIEEKFKTYLELNKADGKFRNNNSNRT